MSRSILLTGATGFVGGHVREALASVDVTVRCGSRRPDEAAQKYPEASWCRVDVTEPATLHQALQGCDAAIYLVHSMGNVEDYAREEREAAQAFASACTEAGVRRVVYLGGVAPEGPPSVHLASRLETGRILREQAAGVIELRAAMIIGAGSESWRICRDLAVRLPLMVLPRWLRTRSHPVAVRDVVAAIVHAVLHDDVPSGAYDVPGPECLRAEDILRRIAQLRGIEPITFRLPVLSPQLSSYWLKLVTTANYELARELIEGLTNDLLPSCPLYWDQMDDHQLQSFDDAALDAMRNGEELDKRTRALERVVHWMARRHRGTAT